MASQKNWKIDLQKQFFNCWLNYIRDIRPYANAPINNGIDERCWHGFQLIVVVVYPDG